MKFNLTLNIFGNVCKGFIKGDSFDNKTLKKIKGEYKNIITRAKDIGSSNTLLSSYALAAFFIAMNRFSSLTPEENGKILEEGMRKSKALKMFMGNAKGYFSEKKMQKRREWSKATKEKKYENDWIVDVIEKGDDFQFGFDYYECGVCKLCKDENCFELAKYMCKLDFMLVELIGIKLKRTYTLAEGGDKCDFRFYK